MIEINLLPGAKKARRGGGGSSFNVGAMFAGISASAKDPFLFMAIGGLVLGLLGTGFLYTTLSSRESTLLEREQTAIQDSTRYAAVLKERSAAQAQRDSVVRQLNIIKTIDGERFVWPHLLDEISEALPPYTWLRTIAQQSPVPSISSRDSLVGPAAATQGPVGPPPLLLRLVGQTVDIQALTRYMRILESSPFLEGVNLVRSDIVMVESREVTEFTLDMRYQPPDSAAIRTVPLNVAVR
jgi:Tfp pilus assembly protein PilN